MPRHLEQTQQQDLDLIRTRVMEMGRRTEAALTTCLRAMVEGNRQLAYAVILRDRFVDALESELDERCQRYLIRHQPVAGQLRYVYGIIKINNELERIGDYAKSIARQFLTLSSIEPPPPYGRIVELANLSIPVLRNALQAFASLDGGLARATRAMEKTRTIDQLRATAHRELVQQLVDGQLPSGALVPLMVIASRLERVADQGGNICEEVVYMSTGEEVRHGEEKVLRILFVDRSDACRTQMAVGIGEALQLQNVQFCSAGLVPEGVDPRAVEFMARKGIDISGNSARYLRQIVDLPDYAVIIALGEQFADLALPPGNTVNIALDMPDPSTVTGTEGEVQAAYEQAFVCLETHINNLVQAIFGEQRQQKEER